MIVCNAEDVVRRIEGAGSDMQKMVEVYILRGACKKAAAGTEFLVESVGSRSARIRETGSLVSVFAQSDQLAANAVIKAAVKP